MGRKRILLLLVVLGVLASAVQLYYKADIEPLHREVGLVVDASEVETFGPDKDKVWDALLEAGVKSALIRSPEEADMIPTGLQTIAVANEESWELWKSSGFQPDAVVFSFNTFPAPIEEVEQVFSTQPYGLMEFRSTSGFAEQGERLAGRTLRVYDRPAHRTHRYANEFPTSVRERQAELVVIRLLLEDTAELNMERALNVGNALRADGHILTGIPAPRPPLRELWVVLWILAIALGAAAGLALFYLLGDLFPAWLYLVLPVVALVGAAVLKLVVSEVLFRQLLALAAAVIYPTTGFLCFWQHSTRRPKSVVTATYKDFLLLVTFALVGGLSVHAFMSEAVFHLKFVQFVGIKLAYLAPLAVAGVLVGWAVWQELRVSGFSWSNRRQRRMVFVGGGLFLAALVVFITRTGNHPIIPVTQLEVDFRDFLFQTLWARPRTKELLGYPALLVGIYLWHCREKILGGLAMLLGWIGVLSLVNTFEHIHHPILLSLARSGLGLLIGLLLSIPAIVFARWFVRFIGSRETV